MCPRVRAINDRAAKPEARHADLVAQCEETTLVAPEPDVLAEARQELVEAMASGSRPQVKVLLAALVHEVRLEGPNVVRPVSKIPAGTAAATPEAVREPSRLLARGHTR